MNSDLYLLFLLLVSSYVEDRRTKSPPSEDPVSCTSLQPTVVFHICLFFNVINPVPSDYRPNLGQFDLVYWVYRPSGL